MGLMAESSAVLFMSRSHLTADDAKRRREEKEGTYPLPLLIYSAPGGLRQGAGRAAELQTEARSWHGVLQ